MDIKTDYKDYCEVCLGDNHSYRKVFLNDIGKVMREYRIYRLLKKDSRTLFCNDCFNEGSFLDLVCPIMNAGLFFKTLHRAIKRGDKKFERFLIKNTEGYCRVCGMYVEGYEEKESVCIDGTNIPVFHHALGSIGGTGGEIKLLDVICRECYEVNVIKMLPLDELPLHLSEIWTDRGKGILSDRFSNNR